MRSLRGLPALRMLYAQYCDLSLVRLRVFRVDARASPLSTVAACCCHRLCALFGCASMFGRAHRSASQADFAALGAASASLRRITLDQVRSALCSCCSLSPFPSFVLRFSSAGCSSCKGAGSCAAAAAAIGRASGAITAHRARHTRGRWDRLAAGAAAAVRALDLPCFCVPLLEACLYAVAVPGVRCAYRSCPRVCVPRYLVSMPDLVSLPPSLSASAATLRQLTVANMPRLGPELTSSLDLSAFSQLR